MRSGWYCSSAVVLMVSAFSVVAAHGDDWVVTRLRGGVSAFDGGSWRPLQRGSVVDDHRQIKSLDGSHAVFTRDKENIELTGATEIRIYDRAGERMTTVMQAYGTVGIEAEHLNVQHFSVQTPYLAAIVKGTKFVVTSDDKGSQVEVDRGIVQVQDTIHDVVANVVQGQDAAVSATEVLDISGAGRIPPIATMEGVVLAQDEIAILRGHASGTEVTTTAPPAGSVMVLAPEIPAIPNPTTAIPETAITEILAMAVATRAPINRETAAAAIPATATRGMVVPAPAITATVIRAPGTAIPAIVAVATPARATVAMEIPATATGIQRAVALATEMATITIKAEATGRTRTDKRLSANGESG